MAGESRSPAPADSWPGGRGSWISKHGSAHCGVSCADLVSAAVDFQVSFHLRSCGAEIETIFDLAGVEFVVKESPFVQSLAPTIILRCRPALLCFALLLPLPSLLAQ